MNAVPLDLPLAEAVRKVVASPEAEHMTAPAAAIAALVADALAGSGWARLRLFAPDEPVDEGALQQLLLDISARLGFLVPQTARGTLLSRIQDEGRDYASHRTRGHQTSADLAFHSDRSDVNLLLYVRTARVGGDISVISYEEAAGRLEQVDPDAHACLFEGFPFDLREERVFESIRWHWRPILWRAEGGLRGHYIRRFIVDSARHPDCPRLNDRQIHALDRFDAILRDLRPERSFSPAPGELLALGNYRVMHARTAFEDAGAGPRLALRTWVAPFASEPLPAFLHPLAGCCEAGVFRGGVAAVGHCQSPPTTAATRIDHD